MSTVKTRVEGVNARGNLIRWKVESLESQGQNLVHFGRVALVKNPHVEMGKKYGVKMNAIVE